MPHEKASTHASNEAGTRPHGKRRRTRESCISDQKKASRDRDQGVARGRGEEIREGKPVKKKSSNRNKKSSPAPAHKKTVSRRVPTWIGKIADVARELNIGERYVYDLQKRGLPRVEAGRYNIPKCFRWYVRYLQRKLVERAHPESGDGSVPGPAAGETRHKLLSIEAELKQIELAEKREQLISIEKVQKDLEAIVVEIRTRILALPPRLAAEVLGETDLAVSQVKIERSLKGALDVLSQFDPDDDVEDRGKARSSSRVS